MPVVKVPHEFFVRERNDIYSEWKIAFFRELFQNSIDAGATDIDITIRQKTVDGRLVTVVNFEDNGCGMTADVLEDVYFCLGKSKKPDGAIGGFGRARILTNFSMLSYEIHTLGNLAKGSGAEYSVEDAPSVFPGCQQYILIDDASVSDMETACKNLLGRCNFKDIKVTLNREEFKNWLGQGEFLRNFQYDGDATPFMFLHKHPFNTAEIIVRAKGLWTFSSFNPGGHLLTLEVSPSMVRQVLRASRDKFSDAYNDIFDAFKAELATESETAVRKQYNKSFVIYRGKGFYNNKKYRSETQVTRRSDAFGGTIKTNNGPVTPITRLRLTLANAMQTVLATGGTETPTFKVSDFLPDIPVYVETQSKMMMEKLPTYKPDNWEFVVHADGIKWVQGRNNFMVLMAWYEAVNHAVQKLLDMDIGYNTLYWSVGWCFSDSAEALMKSIDDGHCFLVRPVDSMGNHIYSMANRASLKKLMASAKHEVAHVISRQHNETFSKIHTDIDERYDEREVFSSIKNLKI